MSENVIPSTFPIKRTPERPVIKMRPPSMFPCEMCHKPTKSHQFPDKTYLCHGCYENLTDEELAAYREQHEKEIRRFDAK